jgi:hypothetical protein
MGGRKMDESKICKGDELIISILDQIEEPIPFISVLSTLIFSAGNISVIGAKQKARKTFFLSMLIVAFLKKKWGSLQGNPPMNPKVLLYDTEQAKAHVFKVVRRIYRMMGWTTPNESLKVFYLREKSVDERVEIIKAQIEKHNPDMVFIDGMVDICKDFNSIEESSKTVQFLMEMSAVYSCHISAVLHENKANGDLRGHLGSMVCQKAETAIKLSKEGDITKVSAEATRNLPFDDFCFQIDEDGIPQIIEVVQTSKTEVMNNKIQAGMKSVLGVNALSYSKLCMEYAEREGMVESTAKRHISQARKAGYIKKESDGNYRFNY